MYISTLWSCLLVRIPSYNRVKSQGKPSKSSNQSARYCHTITSVKSNGVPLIRNCVAYSSNSMPRSRNGATLCAFICLPSHLIYVAESDDDLGIKYSLKISRYFSLTVWREKWAMWKFGMSALSTVSKFVCNYLFKSSSMIIIKKKDH